jgi:hypothetical protein
MPKRVQLPDGRVAEFPDGMDNAAIEQVLQQHFSSQPFTTTGSQIPLNAQASNIGDELKSGVKNLAIGALKGAGHTLNEVGSYLYPDAIAKHLTGVPTEQQKQKYFGPTTPAQQAGYTGEQIGEFFTPTGLEGRLPAVAAKLGPQAAKLAVPAAHIAESALTTGLRNKSQGGEFGTGAEAGAIGGGIGEAAKVAAPTMARMAMGIPKRTMAHGSTPGEAILSETTGIRPATIAAQAEDKLRSTENAMQQLETQHAGNLVSLQPARQAVDRSIAEATERNSTDTLKKLNRIKSQLSTQVDETGHALKVPQTTEAQVASPILDEFGKPVMKSAQVAAPPIEKPIPTLVPPGKARALKQGVGEEVKNWAAENPKLAEQTKAQVYGAINQPFHAAVPGSAELDQKMSSLIPVANYAERRALSAGPGERIAGRFAAHTGALAGGVGGAITGYEHGGKEGALLGGLAGVAIPEMVSSPTLKMAVARVANSPGVPVKLAIGSGLQLDRKKKLAGEEEDNTK